MTAALPPSRGVGVAGTTIAHGALLVLALLASRQPRMRPLTTYEVTLVAAPAPKAGPASVVAPAPKEVAPAPKPKPAKAPPKRVQLQSKQVTPAVKTQVAPAPAEKPSTGTDVVSVRQDGPAFLFPKYLENIENAIFARWQHEGFRPGLDVKVAFVISKDGTVDPKSVQVTKKSSVSMYDNAALAAIELASSDSAFGKLPSGWNGPSLPIEFDFLQARATP